MSCLAWNCRGLGNRRKVPALKKEISSKGPEFIFLCETKLFRRELKGVARKLGFEYCFGVDCGRSIGGGRSGGLGFLWGRNSDVEVSSFFQESH